MKNQRPMLEFGQNNQNGRRPNKYGGTFKYETFCKNGNGHISTPLASQDVSIERIDISAKSGYFHGPRPQGWLSDPETEGSGPSRFFLYLNIPL